MNFFLSLDKHLHRRLSLLVILLLTLLVGCGTTSGTLPAAPSAQPAADIGLKALPHEWSRTKPGCEDANSCPAISVNSLKFPEDAQLSKQLDQRLIMLNLFESEQDTAFNNLLEYEQFFWENADILDWVSFTANIVFKNERFTVLELMNGIYFTGAAHGMSSSEYLNWDNDTQTPITLENMLVPDAQEQFYALLAKAHQQWLATLATTTDLDLDAWLDIWPFHTNDNIALTATGVTVKYNPYAIAPYSFGLPELQIPYAQLQGVLKPDYLLNP